MTNVTPSRILRAAAWLVPLTFLASSSPSASAQNLLINPGFEGALSPWRLEAWQNAPDQVLAEADGTRHRSGSQSLRLTNLQPNDSFVIQELPVEPGAIYRVSGWVRTEGVEGTEGAEQEALGAALCVKGTWIRSGTLMGTQRWSELSLFVKTKPDQTSLSVACRLGYLGNTVKGTAWFDDIQVARVDAAPAGEIVHDLGNPVRNPGFEWFRGSYYEGWNAEAWKASQPAEMEASFDTSVSHAGKAAARLYHPVDNDSRWVQTIAVEPDRVYRVSGWIKTDGVAGTEGIKAENLGATLGLNNTWIRSSDVKGTQPWTAVEFFVKTGQKQTALPIACHLGHWGNSVRGTAWFDDVRVEPAPTPDGKDVPVYESTPASGQSRGRLLLAVILGLVTLATLLSIALAVK